ncbi:ribokinase [Cryobacterium sp. SO2]|uniref:ribokinase n=1 Tax=Cryobacterium sp. SO2 TaxID=1897060 RepID=UPI00223CB997|nr:ribokinase [Cryobacterium sp. SO2]WEO76036.1 ribokinase [Cryobacterium sp. SO2]
MTLGNILVIGSINYDFILSQARLPRRGETLSATAMRAAFGGKGANQAVQAARLGAPVELLGAVGDDAPGRESRANFEQQSVTCILRDSPYGTGLGVVHVTDAGEVYATIFAGANDSVDSDWVEAQRERLEHADMVILQNEIPAEANYRAIILASGSGIPIIYNAAPARPVDPDVTNLCSWFIVNEDEAQFYLGRDLGDVTDLGAMTEAVRSLQRYCPGVILTAGRHGCYISAGTAVHFIEATPAHAVDSTGAGDSFVGAFATALLDGSDAPDAARAASLVAARTVTGVGAQSSMPTREDMTNATVFAPATDS